MKKVTPENYKKIFPIGLIVKIKPIGNLKGDTGSGGDIAIPDRILDSKAMIVSGYGQFSIELNNDWYTDTRRLMPFDPRTGRKKRR